MRATNLFGQLHENPGNAITERVKNYFKVLSPREGTSY